MSIIILSSGFLPIKAHTSSEKATNLIKSGHEVSVKEEQWCNVIFIKGRVIRQTKVNEAPVCVEIEQKTLLLKEGDEVRLGRCHGKENVLSCNGLLPHHLHSISYHHALVIYSSNEFYLKDTSRNGTYVNGCRLKKNENHLIYSGDVIQLASESFSSEEDTCFLTFYLKLFKVDDADFKYLILTQTQYPDLMQLYKRFPDFEYSLEELHLCVRERLQVLQILDDMGDISSKMINLCRLIALLEEKQLHNMIKLITGTSDSFKEELFLQKMDHVSHYVLCVSCCKNYVLKKWFIDQEVKLLQIRWSFLHDQDKSQLISRYFSQNKVGTEEMKELIDQSNGFICSQEEYFKIPMVQVSSLIRSREVFVKSGYCFIPSNAIISHLVTDLVKLMKTNLKSIRTNLHRIWYDERITSIIQYVIKEIRFDRYLFDNKTSSNVVLSEIDKLSNESFPLCMNELHYNLKKRFHLKNGGRLQYGLFLKAIGLSVQDSVTFWRHYFTKKISWEEFMKDYHYHILHSYGIVGKMADYPPQSCKKIIESVPSFDEYHGCPFKVLQGRDIVPLLRRNHITNEGVERILQAIGEGTPRLGCKIYFELKHNSELSEAPYHPNKYFNASRERISAGFEKRSPGIIEQKGLPQGESFGHCNTCNNDYEW